MPRVRRPLRSIAPRYMPSLMNGMTTLPRRSSAIRPPSAFMLASVFIAAADEQHMAALLHHRARGKHGIADPAHRRHRSGAQRRAVHHRSVELVLLIGVEAGAAAGIEKRRILKLDDRGAHRVHRAAVL